MFVRVCFSDVFDVYLKKGVCVCVCVAVKCRQMHMDLGGGGGEEGGRVHERSMQEKDLWGAGAVGGRRQT